MLGAKNGLNLLKLGAKNESNLLKLGAKNEPNLLKLGAKCLIREKVVTFRMVKLNLLLSIFLITK